MVITIIVRRFHFVNSIEEVLEIALEPKDDLVDPKLNPLTINKLSRL